LLRIGVSGEFAGKGSVSESQSAGDLTVSRGSDCTVVPIHSDCVVLGLRRESVATDCEVLSSSIAVGGRNRGNGRQSSVFEVFVRV